MNEIHPLLSKEKQEQARRYERENRWLGLASMLLWLVILLAFYYSGSSAKLASLSLGSSIVWNILIYVISFHVGLNLLSFPLGFYRSFVHEHKWKFSNYTVKTWLGDQIKSFLLGLIFLLIILSLLFWIMAFSPQKWWLISGVSMALVSVILTALFPIMILPIFNKYTVIQNKELTDGLEKILSQGGLRSSGFFKEDTSRQTKKENAFLVGLGRTRRVVLSDNLMKNMTVPEMEAVLAHEVGHFKHRHIWKNLAVGTLEKLAVFYILNLAMKFLYPQFLVSTRANLTLLPMFVILMGAISSVLFRPLSNALSRHREKQADEYALKNIKDKRMFMTALAGLADRNLSNAYPEWWVRLLYYSHPSIGERLKMADNAMLVRQD